MKNSSQINYYQILGVQPNASQEVLDAAYRRQIRLHTGAYLDDAVLVGGPLPLDPFLQRVEEAYRQLSNPMKRWSHDEELNEEPPVPLNEKELEQARKRIEPSGAWLSYQRLESGSLYIRVGWAQNFTEVHNAVQMAIPESGRAYNSRLNEWRIDPRYEEMLAEIFSNFRRADVQAPPRQTGPVYPGLSYIPTTRRNRATWKGWPFLTIGGLVVAIVGAILFPANRFVPLSVQATQTAVALLERYEPLESNFPTATPVAPQSLSATLQFPSVNLREQPQSDAPVLATLGSDAIYQIVGRLEDSSFFVVHSAEFAGWMAAWTVSVDGDPSTLPVYSGSQPLPQPAPGEGSAEISE